MIAGLTTSATRSATASSVLVETPFTDVGPSPFADEIDWLREEGITTGCARTISARRHR